MSRTILVLGEYHFLLKSLLTSVYKTLYHIKWYCRRWFFFTLHACYMQFPCGRFGLRTRKWGNSALVESQCWTVGTIFTFGRSRMFGSEKLRPLAFGCSRRRRIKNVKHVIKVLISNHSNYIGEFYKGPVLIYRNPHLSNSI